MPILYDPPSRRYFESTPCPPNCIVPTLDEDAYELNPKFRWVYNKLRIAELQNIKCGPHGTKPPSYPIFSKPIYNLGGMGADARRIDSQDVYWRSFTAGHMWSELLIGDHYSTDMAIVCGKPIWFSHTRGIPGPQQTWERWEVNISADPSIMAYIARFMEQHLTGYTGMANVETIGGKIIEVHLRFSEQWPDLYGPWFQSCLVGLYAGKGWLQPLQAQHETRVGYSVVLFDDEKYARRGTLINQILRNIEAMFKVSSVTMAYDPEFPLETYARPLGGFRMAWVNGFDLDQCMKARDVVQRCLHELIDSAAPEAGGRMVEVCRVNVKV
jgi:hypothetical protein